MSSVRFDWYQNDNFVIIDLFVKNLNPENVSIDFSERNVKVSISNELVQYDKLFDLCGAVNVGGSKYTIGKVKIEVQLAKKDSLTWKSLEAQEPSTDTSAPPKYPSSAKKPIDADNIEIDTEQPAGEAAINALFQKIYADASEDTRRAMMKSFVESKGTVLSTNWNEVGAKNIEPVPPKNN